MHALRSRMAFFACALVGAFGCQREATPSASSLDPAAVDAASSSASSAVDPRAVAARLLVCRDVRAADPAAGVAGDVITATPDALDDPFVRAIGPSVCNVFSGVRRCFSAVVDPKARAGTLHLELSVLSTDAPPTLQVKSQASTLADGTLATCVTGVLGKAAIGSAGVGKATYTLSFPLVARTQRIAEHDVEVTGLIRAEDVKRVVRGSYPSLRTCFLAGLEKDPQLGGTISFSFLVGSSGAIDGPVTADGTLRDADLRKCALDLFAKMTFPLHEGAKVKVRYPIEFGSE